MSEEFGTISNVCVQRLCKKLPSGTDASSQPSDSRRAELLPVISRLQWVLASPCSSDFCKRGELFVSHHYLCTTVIREAKLYNSASLLTLVLWVSHSHKPWIVSVLMQQSGHTQHLCDCSVVFENSIPFLSLYFLLSFFPSPPLLFFPAK